MNKKHFEICKRCPYFKDGFIILYILGSFVNIDLFGNCRFKKLIRDCDDKLQKLLTHSDIIVYDFNRHKYRFTINEDWKDADFEIPYFFDGINCHLTFEHEIVGDYYEN